MLRLGTVVLGAENVDRATAFWGAVFDYEPVQFANSENDFTILVPRDRVGTRIAVQRSSTPAQRHPRVHLDLVVDNASEQRREVDRLIGLGAVLTDWDSYPDDADFIVLADTEGNRFCIVDASHS
jgi:predicted enzyme related to lactoylglutathione lyase